MADRQRAPIRRPTRLADLRGGGHLAVLDVSPNAIVAVDVDGVIAYANAQAGSAFGYPRDGLLGVSIEALLPDHVAERHAEHRAGFAKSPRARPMGIGLDLRARRRDGTEFPVEIGLSPLETTDGPIVFATVVDITARAAAAVQLLEAERLESIGRLAGGLAHDFGNMLFAIRGFAQILIEDLEAPERDRFDFDVAARRLHAIDDAAGRAADLTKQLLSISQRRVVAPRALGLNDAVRAIEPLLRRLIGESVDLRLSLQPNLGGVWLDPSMLDQILLNLAVHARDAMPQGGRMTMATNTADSDEVGALGRGGVTTGGFVRLSVSDTGVGMDNETRQHVFEPFFATTGHGHGTGLRLAAIQGMVQQAGGHISLDSEFGHGSTFRLYLPHADVVG